MCLSLWERLWEVVRFAPRERVQQRTAEQVVNVPQSLADFRGGEVAPRERLQQRTSEHVVDVPQSLWQRLSSW